MLAASESWLELLPRAMRSVSGCFLEMRSVRVVWSELLMLVTRVRLEERSTETAWLS